MATVSDITRDANAFRAAYPHWPSAEPGPLADVPPNVHMGEYPCTAEKQITDGWLHCNRESGHSETKHLDGRSNREWGDAETFGPAETTALFAAQPPALPWCSTCQRPHVPLAGSCPAPEPCPDCEAPAGRSCYPDCLRFTEGV